MQQSLEEIKANVTAVMSDVKAVKESCAYEAKLSTCELLRAPCKPSLITVLGS